jgi:ribonuclease E
MKRMLFNATQAKSSGWPSSTARSSIDLDIESAAKEQRKSNIYKAVITRVEPRSKRASSTTARAARIPAVQGNLAPVPQGRRRGGNEDEGDGEGPRRIQDQLREGQELIVQVDKDERGNKARRLTTYISLAGRYLVLMPNNPAAAAVSRRVEGRGAQRAARGRSPR